MWKDLAIGKQCGPDSMLMWGKGDGCVFFPYRKLIGLSWVPKGLIKHFQVTKETAAAPLPEVDNTDDDAFEGRAEPRATL